MQEFVELDLNVLSDDEEEIKKEEIEGTDEEMQEAQTGIHRRFIYILIFFFLFLFLFFCTYINILNYIYILN